MMGKIFVDSDVPAYFSERSPITVFKIEQISKIDQWLSQRYLFLIGTYSRISGLIHIKLVIKVFYYVTLF